MKEVYRDSVTTIVDNGFNGTEKRIPGPCTVAVDGRRAAGAYVIKIR